MAYHWAKGVMQHSDVKQSSFIGSINLKLISHDNLWLLTNNWPPWILKKQLPAIFELLPNMIHIWVWTPWVCFHSQGSRSSKPYGLQVVWVDSQSKHFLLVHFKKLLWWVNPQHKWHICYLHLSWVPYMKTHFSTNNFLTSRKWEEVQHQELIV